MVSGFTNNQTNSLGINGVQTVYEIKLKQSTAACFPYTSTYLI